MICITYYVLLTVSYSNLYIISQDCATAALLQGLSALQTLTTLTRLTFWGTNLAELSDSAMQSIAKCQRLRSLNLFVTVTTPASLTRLTQLSELTHLAINAHDEARPFLNPALLTLEAKNKVTQCIGQL